MKVRPRPISHKKLQKLAGKLGYPLETAQDVTETLAKLNRKLEGPEWKEYEEDLETLYVQYFGKEVDQ